MCFVRSDPSLYLSTQDEAIPEFDETNSALDESKRSDAWWVGLASGRDELGGDKSDHDETIWGADETNSSATRGIGRIHDEMIWEVDETNLVHNETNRNNDSTTRNANLVSDLTSYETNKWSCESKHFVTSSWEMKLTGKKSFCKEADNFFPSGKKQLFAYKLPKRNQFKHLVVVSSRHQLTRLLWVQCNLHMWRWEQYSSFLLFFVPNFSPNNG